MEELHIDGICLVLLYYSFTSTLLLTGELLYIAFDKFFSGSIRFR